MVFLLSLALNQDSTAEGMHQICNFYSIITVLLRWKLTADCRVAALTAASVHTEVEKHGRGGWKGALYICVLSPQRFKPQCCLLGAHAD